MSALGLGLGLSLGKPRTVGGTGELPATFSIAAGSVDDGVKRINFSEPVTVTITGDVTANFGDGQGELTAGTHTVSDTLDYWTLEINGGTGGGTITFGKRKQVTYLYLAYLNSSIITGDITGMKLKHLLLYSLGLSTITGDISGMGLTYLQASKDAGELPATFTIPAGFANAGIKRINFSEPVTVTMTGGVTLSIGSTQYQSGDTIPVATGEYHTLTINNPGEAGTITFGKRKQITYLDLSSLGSSVITGDITGMELTYLRLSDIGSSVITGDITGMKLTSLTLYDLGSSVITGDITGMELTYLTLSGLGSSVITGDITGMELTYLFLNNIGSSLTYGTNLLNITNANGVQLRGDTVFATSQEYVRLIHDAATGTWDGVYPFRIDAGTNDNCPDWDTVKSDVAVLRGKASWTIIPAAWLTTGGGSWPTNWYEYTGE